MTKQKILMSVMAVVVGTVFAMPAIASDAAAGKAKYEMLCTSCHGAGGLGDGAAAVALTPKPSNLVASTKTDAELAKIIKEGGAANGLSPLMIAWGATLTDDDIANVVAYIHTLKK